MPQSTFHELTAKAIWLETYKAKVQAAEHGKVISKILAQMFNNK